MTSPNDAFIEDGASRRLEGMASRYLSGSNILRSDDFSLGDFRIKALKQTELMPLIREYQWIQIGPSCVPFGDTDSPMRVLVSGRVTSIVVVPKDPKIIYLGTV